jgi:hypothetical protein
MSRWAKSVALAASIAMALLASSAVAPAAGPYEPNESISAAAGPLLQGTIYGASIETASDADFFFFYVTDAESDVSLTVANKGGGSPGADFDARIVDALGMTLGNTVPYLRSGESRAATLTLPIGKYFVEVAANEGSGDSYSLTPGGGAGAFGSYAEIADHCEGATGKAAALQVGLTRAEGKLQRARNKFRRSRFSGRDARRLTHARLVTARERVVAKKTALRKATRVQSLFCDVPQ